MLPRNQVLRLKQVSAWVASCVEELNRSLDRTDSSHDLAAGFKARSGRQSRRSRGRGSRSGGDRGKRNGKGRLLNRHQ